MSVGTKEETRDGRKEKKREETGNISEIGN